MTDSWSIEQVEDLIKAHHKRLATGYARSASFRMEQLRKLGDAIRPHEQDLLDALRQDLGKSEFEAYSTEIGFTLNSIRYTMKHLKRWMKPVRVSTPFYHVASSSRIYKEPYGTVLIVGPFNYPFQLLIEPLIGAIAAGNSAVLKPSENTPNVSAVIRKLIAETFEPDYVQVIEGEKETTSALIHAPFDYIFFTGSVPVGRIVMEAASHHLVPVTLELGGKSPVIVDHTANLDSAAERIVWGKMLNAGQTCIAPDYMLVDERVKDALIEKMRQVLARYFGQDASQSKDYGRIVNTRQFDRLSSILNSDKECIVYGGAYDRDSLYIEPTLIEAAGWSDASMQDEIFGPILPILTFSSLDEAIRLITEQPKPLALYLFTEDREAERQVLANVSFGGGCINDTISHVANHHLPFGGVGNAGMGAYHGKHSFELFSHQKSVLKKSTRLNLSFLFPPYKDKVKLVRKIMK